MTRSSLDPALVAAVLNWNGGEETCRCLATVRRSEGVEVTPLLVDNGSVDGSVERALAEDPALRVLRLGENHGFTGGNNRALRHAFDELGAEWVCLLNSDVELEPATLARLVAAVRGARGIGAVGPCLVYRDRPDVVWACGGRIAPGLNVTRLIDHGRRGVPPGPPFDVDYLPGACLLVSREACERAGLLDDAFFAYLEDADWCVRVRRAGLRVVAVPDAVARHALSSTTGGGYSPGRKYMTGVNSVRFLRKHGRPLDWAALLVFDLLLWPLAWLRALVIGRPAGAVAKLKGVVDGLRGERVTAEVAERYARRRPS